MAEVIDIALAADSGYFCGLLVTASSIAKYAREDARLRFNILDGGIDKKDWKLLEKGIKGLHRNSEFRRLPVDENLFKKFPAWHGNKMAYARLMLPDVLQDVEWCIYCDVDFLWLNDICKLWSERDDKYAFIGTIDGVESTLEMEKVWFEKNGYPFDADKYFCSGLCFFNLKAFREQELATKIAKILEKHTDIQYPDQAALNIVTFGQTKLVDKNWQQFHQYVTPAMVKDGVVVHFAGAIPWRQRKGMAILVRDLDLKWYKINAEVRDISLWKSLRMYLSVGYILWHRGLRDIIYVLNQMKCLELVGRFISNIGHAQVWNYWTKAIAKFEN